MRGWRGGGGLDRGMVCVRVCLCGVVVRGWDKEMEVARQGVWKGCVSVCVCVCVSLCVGCVWWRGAGGAGEGVAR